MVTASTLKWLRDGNLTYGEVLEEFKNMSVFGAP